MFDLMMVERVKMEQGTHYRDDDGIRFGMKPVKFKASPVDRAFFFLGEAMINLGQKLKDRPQASLKSEKAQAPNFLIML
jgi:hypothetical protein